MKELHVFYGAASLRQLRQLHGYTVQQEANMIPCSTRTINRIEEDNRTSNKAIAKKLAEIFHIPFWALFIKAEQHFLDTLESIAPEPRHDGLLGGTKYYLLYVCRASWWETRIWGKTMWIGHYDMNYELRKLHPLNNNAEVARYLQGLLVINTKDDWDGFFYRAKIGNCHQLIVSEKCLQSRAPYVLGTYAVHRKILRETVMTGETDVILLGQYRYRPGVFGVDSATAGVRG